MSGSIDNSAGTTNAWAGVGGSYGSELTRILLCESIQPGSDVSYQTCKTLYAFHPLGAKIADDPIILAQSQRREISIPNSPESRVKEAFEAQWQEMDLDSYIFGIASTSRIYGIGSLFYGAVGKDGKALPTNEPIDPWDLHKYQIYFSVADPLNTAGSLVLNQDPNSPDFQKTHSIAVAGQPYHSSRAVVLMNERPLYIEWSNPAFGFTGRSVYQRSLYPLKSFIRCMKTDEMVARKSGLLIAKIKQPGSIINNLMQIATGVKRALLKEAQTDEVLSIDPDEAIETLNMQNIDGAYGQARKNILENIAAATPMPAIMLNGETFAEGFGEGTEDAKKVAHFINRIRMWMQRVYAFCDVICMYKAWTPEFYETIQAEFPDYRKIDYKTAFMQWKNSFKAEWPSLLIEPESELAKAEDVKLKAIIAMLEILLPQLDPENMALTIQWAAENFNDLKLLFTSPLILDYDSLSQFMEERKKQQDEAAQATIAPPEAAPPESGRT